MFVNGMEKGVFMIIPLTIIALTSLRLFHHPACSRQEGQADLSRHSAWRDG
jgi:hypothetical protein